MIKLLPVRPEDFMEEVRAKRRTEPVSATTEWKIIHLVTEAIDQYTGSDKGSEDRERLLTSLHHLDRAIAVLIAAKITFDPDRTGRPPNRSI